MTREAEQQRVLARAADMEALADTMQDEPLAWASLNAAAKDLRAYAATLTWKNTEPNAELLTELSKLRDGLRERLVDGRGDAEWNDVLTLVSASHLEIERLSERLTVNRQANQAQFNRNTELQELILRERRERAATLTPLTRHVEMVEEVSAEGERRFTNAVRTPSTPEAWAEVARLCEAATTARDAVNAAVLDGTDAATGNALIQSAQLAGDALAIAARTALPEAINVIATQAAALTALQGDIEQMTEVMADSVLRERIDSLRSQLTALQGEQARLKGEKRAACQTLIDSIGSVGPENVEDAAKRAVSELDALVAHRNSLTSQLITLQGRWEALMNFAAHELDASAFIPLAAEATRLMEPQP